MCLLVASQHVATKGEYWKHHKNYEEGREAAQSNLGKNRGWQERRPLSFLCSGQQRVMSPLCFWIPWCSASISAFHLPFPTPVFLKQAIMSSQWGRGFTDRLECCLYISSPAYGLWGITLLLFAQLLSNITLKHYMHNYVQLYEMNLFYLMLIL